MTSSIPPIEYFINSATTLIGTSSYDQALRCIDHGFTYYPRSPYLVELLLQLPPDHVDYSPSRDQRARLAAGRYYDVLARFLKNDVRSAIEFGSGQGSWISRASDFFNIPTSECLAIDGPWAFSWHDTHIPYQECDFNQASCGSILEILSGRNLYDLSICVEVCEHLSEQSAKTLVSAITSNSRLAIFGSALTGQFGQGHRNCRSHYYWRALFQSAGFQLYDIFRPHLQDDSQVPAWYLQNTFLYVHSSCLNDLLNGQVREYCFPPKSLDIPYPSVINHGMQYSLCREKSDKFQSLIWSVI